MLKRDTQAATGRADSSLDVSTMAQADSANAPSASPSNLIATASSTQVHLTWQDNSSNEDILIVKRRLASEVYFAEIATVGANVSTYSDSQVLPNTTYVYRVRAFPNAGGRVASNDAMVTTPVFARHRRQGTGRRHRQRLSILMQLLARLQNLTSP
jgi:predicted phage tail protein